MIKNIEIFLYLIIAFLILYNLREFLVNKIKAIKEENINVINEKRNKFLKDLIQGKHEKSGDLKKLKTPVRFIFLLIFILHYGVPMLKGFLDKNSRPIKTKQQETHKRKITKRCCMVTQTIWEKSNGCFNGVKLSEQTKCTPWACSPRGSGIQKKLENECIKGHSGKSDRYQYLNYRP